MVHTGPIPDPSELRATRDAGDDRFTEAETPTTRTRLRQLGTEVDGLRRGTSTWMTTVIALQLVTMFLVMVCVLQTCGGGIKP